jgi:type II secretory pathway pseudopilin PulG
MKRIRCRGWALTEFLVGIAVISMMTVSLLQFISFAGDVWQRNQLNVGLTAEATTALDLISREMSSALAVSLPIVGNSGSELVFTKTVRDSCQPACSGAATFKIALSTRELSVAYFSDLSAGWSVDTVDGDKKLNTDRYAFPFARHVEAITFTRVNVNRLDVELTLSAKRATDGLDKEVKMKRTILIPQA